MFRIPRSIRNASRVERVYRQEVDVPKHWFKEPASFRRACHNVKGRLYNAPENKDQRRERRQKLKEQQNQAYLADYRQKTKDYTKTVARVEFALETAGGDGGHTQYYDTAGPKQIVNCSGQQDAEIEKKPYYAIDDRKEHDLPWWWSIPFMYKFYDHETDHDLVNYLRTEAMFCQRNRALALSLKLKAKRYMERFNTVKFESCEIQRIIVDAVALAYHETRWEKTVMKKAGMDFCEAPIQSNENRSVFMTANPILAIMACLLAIMLLAPHLILYTIIIILFVSFRKYLVRILIWFIALVALTVFIMLMSMRIVFAMSLLLYAIGTWFPQLRQLETYKRFLRKLASILGAIFYLPIAILKLLLLLPLRSVRFIGRHTMILLRMVHKPMIIVLVCSLNLISIQYLISMLTHPSPARPFNLTEIAMRAQPSTNRVRYDGAPHESLRERFNLDIPDLI